MCVILHRSCRSIKGVHASSQPPSQIKKKKKKTRGQRTCIAERLRNEFIELAVRCVRLVKLDGMERWMAKLAGCRGVTWGGEGRGHTSRVKHISLYQTRLFLPRLKAIRIATLSLIVVTRRSRMA